MSKKGYNGISKKWCNSDWWKDVLVTDLKVHPLPGSYLMIKDKIRRVIIVMFIVIAIVEIILKWICIVDYDRAASGAKGKGMEKMIVVISMMVMG